MKSFIVATLAALATAQGNDFYDLGDDANWTSTGTVTSSSSSTSSTDGNWDDWESMGTTTSSTTHVGEWQQVGGSSTTTTTTTKTVTTSVSGWEHNIDWQGTLTTVMSSMSWAQFREILQSEERIYTLAQDISDSLYTTFRADKQGTLPQVCDGGQACRDRIWEQAKVDLTAEWVSVLNRINQKLDATWLDNFTTIEAGYKKQFVCEAGCYCEEIEGTYTDHILLQRELERQITTLEKDVTKLYKDMTDILVTCPDYEESALEVPEWVVL